MTVRSKLVYALAAVLAFLPLSSLLITQSILAIENSYDSTLLINSEAIEITDIIAYDQYNNNITHLLDEVDAEGKPILFSVLEATDHYLLFDFHGGKIDGVPITISNIQFELANDTATELLHGLVYLRFKNIMPNSWEQDFVDDINSLYTEYYEQPAGTVSFVWVKIIGASAGTLLGLATVLFVVLRKSTKALVKRYWRISVLVALIQGTLILGLITWVIGDIFHVFAATTIGWAIFLGVEKLAVVKGYLARPTMAPTEELPTALTEVRMGIDNLLAKYRK
jgi:hypothetical protein